MEAGRARARGVHCQFDTCAMRLRIKVVTISVTIGSAACLRVSFAEKVSVSWLVSQRAIMFPFESTHWKRDRKPVNAGKTSAAAGASRGAYLEALCGNYPPLVLFGVLRPKISGAAHAGRGRVSGRGGTDGRKVGVCPRELKS